jgi:bifunctional non-homologous end joining protein LigD
MARSKVRFPKANTAAARWLLIKANDEEAREASDPDILVDEPQSVVSGRDIDEVGEGDEVWDSSSGRQQPSGEKPRTRAKRAKRAGKSEDT